MKHLVFPYVGSRIRAAVFEERSSLPVSAACVVANAVREQLSALAGTPVELRLWPPAIPEADAWQTLLRDAQVHYVRGACCDAAFILRRVDAQALAALLFGERIAYQRRATQLSRLEDQITRRAVERVVPALTPVCGECAARVSPANLAFITYFELHVVEPVELCLGVALSREPAAVRTKGFAVGHVLPAAVEVIAEIPLRAMRAAVIAALKRGDVLEIAREGGTLRVGNLVVARGRCGVRTSRYAFEVCERAS
jgi:hypothetical protein